MSTETRQATDHRRPWTAPRLESLDVAATLAGTDVGKEGGGTGNISKKLLS